MRSVREPAVAGLFYPDSAEILTRAVDEYVYQSSANENENEHYLSSGLAASPKAIIVPHAGYVYSGSTAGRAFHQLTRVGNKIKRVILLGPSHRVGFRGIAFCSADYFRTPLGDVPVDHSAVVAISDLPQVGLMDSAHEQEHSLEVQLPFLQTVLTDFKVVPLVVGDADKTAVAAVIERLWGDDSTLFVISSDLSHYNDYITAQSMDNRTCEAIEFLQPDDIHYEQACGRNPLNGLLEVARHRHMRVETLGLCNSGDTSGDKSRVVGYGAWALWETQ